MTDKVNPPPDLATRVHAKLVALGDTKTDVAASLDEASAYGRLSSTTSNPISRYLEDCGDLGIYRAQDMGGYFLVFTPDEVATVELPAPANEFLTDFELGRYPGLEEPPARAARRLLGGGARLQLGGGLQ